MLKKMLITILACILLVSVSACGGNSQSSGGNGSEQTGESTGNNGTKQSAETAEEPKFEEVMVADNEECTVKITGLDKDSIWGYSLNVYMENKSQEKTYMFAVDSAAVDGVQCDPLFASEVAPGKKSNEKISFSSSALEKNDIKDFTDIEINFRVYDSNNWEADAVAEENVHIYPHGENAVKLFQREAQETDKVIADNEYVKVTVIGYEEDDTWGYGAELFIENKSDANVMVAAEDVAVNGYMADPLFAQSVLPGKCAFGTMSWSDESFSENNIETVEEIDFTLRVYDNDKWDKEYVKEKITLNP